jgi:predicted nucleic acid-binding protein
MDDCGAVHRRGARLARPFPATAHRSDRADAARYEVASVLRRKTRDGEITDAAAKLALRDILRIVTLVPFDYALTERAIDIAASTRQKAAYDAHYLALAEREGADFWTADQPFFTAAHGQFPQVRWVGAYPSLPGTS